MLPDPHHWPRAALLGTLCGGLAYSCTTESVSVQPELEAVAIEDATPLEPSPSPLFLWEVSSPNQPGKVWLMGSIHIGKKRPELDETIWSSFEAADYLAVEIDLDFIDGDELLQKFVQAGSYPRKQNLHRVIGQTLFQRIEAEFEDAALDTSVLNRMRPWFAMQLLQNARAQTLGFSSAYGLDRLFISHARTIRPIRSLESLETQLGAISSASETLQIAMLSNFLVQGPSLSSDEVDELIAAYERGDDEYLAASERRSQGSPELKAFTDAMLRKRNVGMVETIREYLSEDERGFVVVGAAHLVGDNSVVKLLEEAGLNTVRLVASGEVAEVPERGPGDRPRAVGYTVDWRGPASPPLSRWRDGKLADIISARSGNVLFKLSVVPLTEKELTIPLNIFFASVSRSLAKSTRAHVVGRTERDVHGVRGQIMQAQGRSHHVSALMAACDRKLYVLTALVRRRKPTKANRERTEAIFDSFALRVRAPPAIEHREDSSTVPGETEAL